MSRPYQDLFVWQRSRELAIAVYRMTASAPFRRDWALRDQMRRAAISVPSNIAEGNARGSSTDCVRFLVYARGSLAELATQTDIANAIGLLDAGSTAHWLSECDALARMLSCLIRARKPSTRS